MVRKALCWLIGPDHYCISDLGWLGCMQRWLWFGRWTYRQLRPWLSLLSVATLLTRGNVRPSFRGESVRQWRRLHCQLAPGLLLKLSSRCPLCSNLPRDQPRMHQFRWWRMISLPNWMLIEWGHSSRCQGLQSAGHGSVPSISCFNFCTIRLQREPGWVLTWHSAFQIYWEQRSQWHRSWTSTAWQWASEACSIPMTVQLATSTKTDWRQFGFTCLGISRREFAFGGRCGWRIWPIGIASWCPWLAFCTCSPALLRLWRHPLGGRC